MVKKCLDSSRTVCQVMKCEYEFHVLAKCYLRTTWFNTNIVHTIVNGKTTTCRVLILYEKRFQQHINISHNMQSIDLIQEKVPATHKH